MPALPTIGLFVVAALGLLLFPGPAVLYITTRSATQGRRAGLASVLGVELGSLTHALAAALGLSALLLSSALAFSAVKYLGAAYLIYLGLRALVSGQEAAESLMPAPRSLSRLCANGFLVQLLNPKTALFFYAFLPQFVDPARGAAAEQMLVLGMICVALAATTDSLYALLGSSVGRWLTRNARVRHRQRFVTGGIYIALGVGAAVAGGERR
jgi:threonine/homoserine/homoserine lactone efflux protein